ncbi:MAG: hypothetical protein KAT47_03540, partial [Candidatus Aegiribacteria sp.]|nr:hypothetical protein [Candidatus Aegiribacteria sp.]
MFTDSFRLSSIRSSSFRHHSFASLAGSDEKGSSFRRVFRELSRNLTLGIISLIISGDGQGGRESMRKRQAST